MSDLEMFEPGINDDDISFRHVTQEGNQCRDAGIASTNHDNLESLQSRYVKWQKRHVLP
jgi:hypothetical protein